jgi:hypothetical protein
LGAKRWLHVAGITGGHGGAGGDATFGELVAGHVGGYQVSAAGFGGAALGSAEMASVADVVEPQTSDGERAGQGHIGMRDGGLHISNLRGGLLAPIDT